MRMLGRLLGVPDSDGPWLVERGDALLGNFDPDFTDHPVGLSDTDEFKAIPFRSPPPSTCTATPKSKRRSGGRARPTT